MYGRCSPTDEGVFRVTGWFVISDDAFKEALQRAKDGEDPEMLFMEYYANTEEN